MRAAVLALMLAVVTGCATRPVPESRQQQVQQATQTGIYSYQRAIGGPPR